MGTKERLPVAYIETWGTTYINGKPIEHGRQLVRADLLHDLNENEWEVRDSGDIHTILKKAPAVHVDLYEKED